MANSHTCPTCGAIKSSAPDRLQQALRDAIYQKVEIQDRDSLARYTLGQIISYFRGAYSPSVIQQAINGMADEGLLKVIVHRGHVTIGIGHRGTEG